MHPTRRCVLHATGTSNTSNQMFAMYRVRHQSAIPTTMFRHLSLHMSSRSQRSAANPIATQPFPHFPSGLGTMHHYVPQKFKTNATNASNPTSSQPRCHLSNATAVRQTWHINHSIAWIARHIMVYLAPQHKRTEAHGHKTIQQRQCTAEPQAPRPLAQIHQGSTIARVLHHQGIPSQITRAIWTHESRLHLDISHADGTLVKTTAGGSCVPCSSTKQQANSDKSAPPNANSPRAATLNPPQCIGIATTLCRM